MFSESLKDFFAIIGRFPQPWPIIIIGTVSLYFIIVGVLGLKNKKISIPFTPYTYEGRESVAPSITFIFIGMLFPLLLISAFIDAYYNTNGYAMPIMIVSVAGVVVFLIFYRFFKFKPSNT